MDRSKHRSRLPIPHSFPPPLARCHSARFPPPLNRALESHGLMQKRPNAPQDGPHEQPKKRPRTVMPASRASAAPSPKTLDETIANYSSIMPMEKDFEGVPRLSVLALASARAAVARGLIQDLSGVADEYGYTLLSGQGIGPDVLTKLEVRNPSRVGLFEALWAKLVRDKYNIQELPIGCRWWREFYEENVREDKMKLERAGERLRKRYILEQERSGRKMASTRRLHTGERRRRMGGASGGGMSRMARLREEVRRDMRKR